MKKEIKIIGISAIILIISFLSSLNIDNMLIGFQSFYPPIPLCGPEDPDCVGQGDEEEELSCSKIETYGVEFAYCTYCPSGTTMCFGQPSTGVKCCGTGKSCKLKDVYGAKVPECIG
mgnify:CR=1 FL=1